MEHSLWAKNQSTFFGNGVFMYLPHSIKLGKSAWEDKKKGLTLNIQACGPKDGSLSLSSAK